MRKINEKVHFKICWIFLKMEFFPVLVKMNNKLLMNELSKKILKVLKYKNL